MPIDNSIQSIIDDKTQWTVLGEGGYNKAYVSTHPFTMGEYTGHWVLKKPTSSSSKSDINRAVRKWNILNPSLPSFKHNNAWLVPYLGQNPASDKQIAEKLIEIYQNTGEIIGDACGKGNFLVYQGKVICIDMDFSFCRGSLISDEYFNDKDNIGLLMKYLGEYSTNQGKPNSVSVIKTLLYLENHLPNYDKKKLITRCVVDILSILRRKSRCITAEIMDILLDIEGLADLTHELIHVHFTPQLIRTIQSRKKHSPMTTEIILHLAREQLWDRAPWASEHYKNEWLESIRHVIHVNPSCINNRGQEGYTLLHLACMYSQLELACDLMKAGADLNITTPVAIDERIEYPNMTAIEIAAKSNADIAILLADKGAHIPAAWRALLPKDEIETKPDINPLRQLYTELECWSKTPMETSKKRQTALMSLIKDTPSVLTWSLDETGATFLFNAFSHPDAAHLIQQFIKLPQWDELSKTTQQKTGWTLLHQVAFYNQETLAVHLKSVHVNAVTKGTQASALHFAALNKRHALCNILLEYGANPRIKNGVGETAEMLWSGAAMKNPLTQFREEIECLARHSNPLSKARKHELLVLIKQHPHLLIWCISKNSGFLELIFEKNHVPLIDETIRLSEWDQLSKTINPGTKRSLFQTIAKAGQEEYYDRLKHLPTTRLDWIVALSLAAEHGHEGFCKRLLVEGIDLKACNRDCNPLIGAAKNGHANICTLLLQFGANPCLKNNLCETPEMLWAGTHSNNPFKQLSQALCHLANQTGDLPETEKQTLLALVKQHTHLLTWSIGQKSTFLELIFETDHAALINEMRPLPQWIELSKTQNPKTHWSLFDTIAKAGQEKHYDRLKHVLRNQSDRDFALSVAAQRGHEAFCKRLLTDENSCFTNETLKKTQALWRANSPLKNNIFNLFCRAHDLEEKKKQLIERIESEIGSAGCFFYNHSSEERTLLDNLKNTILASTFNSTDSSDRTAEDVLNDVIDTWGSHSNSNPSTRTLFFSRDPKKWVGTVVPAMKTMLVSKCEGPSTALNHASGMSSNISLR